jgi:hypothetical protein
MIIWILFGSSNDTGTPHNQRHPACVTEETEVTASSSNQPKQQSENQVLGDSRYSRSKPTDKERPDLHQLVHQRLRTTMDILGREPKDQPRPRTNCWYWWGGCMRLRNRRLRRRPLSGPSVTFASCSGTVVSSLVSSVYVRRRSLMFRLMRQSRSRTLTVFDELLSRLLKIGRSIPAWGVNRTLRGRGFPRHHDNDVRVPLPGGVRVTSGHPAATVRGLTKGDRFRSS